MRVPHYLSRARSGLFSFRLRVPADLVPLVGVRLLKRTLRTDHLPTARVRAIALADGYARAFAVLRAAPMNKKMTVEDVLASVAEHGKRDYTLTLPNGFTLQANDAADHRRAMEAVEAIGPLVLPPTPASPAPAPPAPPPAVSKVVALEDARDDWLDSIRASTIPKTYTIKKTAITDFTAFIGPKKHVHTITRADVASWFQHLRKEGVATPTLTSKQSYIGGRRGFFTWAMASGCYPQGDNPATGHVSYGAQEKRRRRKLGFQPYTREQVSALFDPDAMADMAFYTRWAAMIGVYAGARAAEVGQLSLLDVLDEGDGLWSFRFTDEGEDQRLKNEASQRITPIHPHLLQLGFLDFVQAHREASEWRLFPNGDPKALNGPGNWISKSFSRHLANVGKGWRPAKRGFHSFRKTVIQELQGKGVAAEMRAQLVGHDLEDEHFAAYSRTFTPAEKLNGARHADFQSPGLAVLDWGFDLAALAPLLAPTEDNLKPCRGRRQKVAPL